MERVAVRMLRTRQVTAETVLAVAAQEGQVRAVPADLQREEALVAQVLEALATATVALAAPARPVERGDRARMG